MKKKIGLLGGSFDPIHFGHINLAIEIKENLGLDEIVFCPAYISPFKELKPPIASAKDRLVMLKKAIHGIKGFSIIDIETKFKNVSYTIDTLEKIKKEDVDLHLIVTENMLHKFHLWKDYKKILELAPLIVGVRKNFTDKFESSNFSLKKHQFVKTKILEISSTAIRQRIQDKKYCCHLTPKEVLDYIYFHKLYY